MAVKFKKNDQVFVTTGKSKGHVGVIERVDKDGYVIVTGANMKKKHVKPQQDKPGEIKSVEGRIHRSNVAHYDGKNRIKVGFKLNDDQVKIRFNKANGEQI